MMTIWRFLLLTGVSLSSTRLKLKIMLQVSFNQKAVEVLRIMIFTWYRPLPAAHMHIIT